MTGEVRRPAAHVYLEAPLRRPTSVTVPALLVVAAAIAAGFLLPKQYRASVRLGIEPGLAQATPSPQADASDAKRRVIEARMLSRSRLEQVVADATLYPEATSAAARVERLRSALTVRLVGADRFSLDCVHGDPRMAARVADRVATLFVEEAERQHQQWESRSPEQLEARLAAARQTMEEMEAALRPSPPHTSTQVAPRPLQVERQALRGKIVAAQSEADLLRASIELERRERSAVTLSRASPELEQLRSRLAELRKRYTDRYPDVQAVLRRIQELEAAEAATPEPDTGAPAAQAELEGKEREIEALKQRAASLDAEISRLGPAASRPADTAEGLAKLTRDYEQAQKTYLALLEEWTQARAAQSLDGSASGDRFRILEAARVPETHFFPRLPVFVLAGLVAGLGLGLAVALTREFLDHSVKGPEDLEEILPQPLLATIPHVGRANEE